MPRWLELHDSTLLSFSQTSVAVRIVLDGYVHHWEADGNTRRGTGWTQTVGITVTNAVDHLTPPVPPVGIAAGGLRVGEIMYDNLIPVPIDESEPVNLHLKLIGQDPLDVIGREVRVEPVGEPKYVEDLPADLRPLSAKE